MYKRFVYLIALLIFFVGFSTQASAFSLTQLFNFNKERPVKLHVSSRNNNKDKTKYPVHVKVGVYLLHVGKYDFQNGTTRMDFYLIFRCKPVCDDLNFEIMNATSSTVNLAVKQQDYLVYRVQADLNEANNLRCYPFDKHTLDIVIENRKMTSDKMIFEVDPSLTALDSDVDVVGFDLVPTWKASVTNHFYKVFQETFSSYKFSISITRPAIAGLLKGILPALIIIWCSFLALFTRIEHLSQRLGIATSTLIASVVFHLNLTASIPPLGYITFADMFMLINYLFLLFVLIEVIVTTYFTETKHHGLAEKINIVCAWSLPLIWILFQLINIYAFHHNALNY